MRLTWVVHPLRHQHNKTFILLCVLALTATFVYMSTASIGWTFLGVLVLLFGVIDYLVPVTFKLTDKGVESRMLIYRRQRPWSMLRSFYTDKNGVLLSPFPTRSRLDTFRGLYIRFDGNREAVLAIVRERLGQDAE